MLLGDMGADIIKVERPSYGDGSRSMGHPMPGFPSNSSDYYLSLNRNKRSVVIDLSQTTGVELAVRLASVSDIVVENFRPGVMDRLGVGFGALSAVRPNLIYCSITAFGEDGPWSSQPANDIIVQSVSGLMGVTGEVGGGPVRIGAPVCDFSAGLFALAAILAALQARGTYPDGQHVRISMLEASLNILCNYIPSVSGLGETIPRLGRAHAQIVPYQAFECADGNYLMVGAFTRQFWMNLCNAIERPEWTADARFSTNSARLRNRTELIGELELVFASRPRDVWLEVLAAADVPTSPVLELHDTVNLEQVVSRASIVRIQEGERQTSVVRSPIRVDEWPAAEWRMPPVLGEDTENVLRDLLQMSESELHALAVADVIGCPQTTTE
jgi:crotonobetainyl-CoA:carnitine CoA-transferase CaiB-like acyl-CoA transferase